VKKLLLVFAIMVAAVACYEDPVSTSISSNSNVAVSLLFEHDGCKVFRFRDGASSYYYTNCRGETMGTRSCGKNCVRKVRVPTHLEENEEQRCD